MNAEFPNVEAPNPEAPNVETPEPEALCSDCPGRRIVNGRIVGFDPVPDHPDDILGEALQAYECIFELLAIGHDKPDMGCVTPSDLLVLLDIVKKKLRAAQAGYYGCRS